MSDSAAPSAAPSPTAQPTLRPNAEPPKHGEPDKHGWSRPEPKPSQSRVNDPKPDVPRDTKGESKEKPTSEKPDIEKKETKAADRSSEVDDDPEDELEDSKGNKIKRKRSEWKKLAARAAEIERESHARFQDSAKNRKDLDAREQRLKGLFAAHANDPWAIQRAMFIERDGLTAEQADAKMDELAESRLMRTMQRERLTPEQQEAADLKAENARLKAENEKREETDRETKRGALKAEHRKHWDKVIGDTMTEHKLAPTRRVAALVAKAISDHAVLDQATGKVVSIPPAIAARIVREQLHTEITTELPEMIAASPETVSGTLAQLAKSNPAQALAAIPPELRKLILAEESKKHRDFVPQGNAKQPTTERPQPKPKVPLTIEEARQKRLGINHY